MRVNEIFRSISGEVGAIQQGAIAMFVRFQGCNLHCKWPCDTEYALDPIGGVEMSYQQILERIPYQSNVVLTGGEPFLQPKDEMIKLVKGLKEIKTCSVQIETNGSIFCTYLDVPFVLDYKLPSSGMTRIMMPDCCFVAAPDESWIKFVIKTGIDLQMAIQKIKDFEDLSYYRFSSALAVEEHPPTNRKRPLKYALSVETGQFVDRAFEIFDHEDFDFPLHRIAVNVQIHKILGLA